MKIYKDDIHRVFNDLINETITRDETELWAENCMRESDNRTLEYEKPELEMILWDAIIYFSGVGMMNDPNTFLHSLEDIKADYEERWKNL